MPLRLSNLGNVLLRIYDFDPGAGIYLPSVEVYKPDTPCFVASMAAYTEAEENALHQECLNRGFVNWLNVAAVSDTCDDVATHTEEALLAAFNEDCRMGGWLWKMMNYRNPPPYAAER